MNITVKQLSERPEFVETVGLWIYNEWWSKRHNSPEVVFGWLRTHKEFNAVPYTVVCFADGRVSPTKPESWHCVFTDMKATGAVLA